VQTTAKRETPALIITTRNDHKAGEIRAILGDGFRYLTLNDFPAAPKVVEDADTFAGNAAKKATELARWISSTPIISAATRHSSQTFVLADDSGLEVDALNGAPGVRSARFATLDQGADLCAAPATSLANSPDADNNSKLLRLLKDVPAEKRIARFRCVVALTPAQFDRIESASPVCYANEFELQTVTFDGVCEGRIGFEPRGENGFGYDPLFTPDGFDQTFAELGDDVKNKLSHRAMALKKLKTVLLR
jgi:XTP/dITP diphosphohydrolase